MYYTSDHVAYNIYTAYHYLTKVAQQGHASALFFHSKIHFEKKEFKDITQGFKFLTQSAENNLVDEQYGLAVRYFNGDGIQRNPNLSAFWCLKAKNKGFAETITLWSKNSLQLFNVSTDF